MIDLFPINRIYTYEIVSDGEKWAVKRSDGRLFYRAEYGRPFFLSEKTDDGCWFESKEEAEIIKRRLEA